MTLLSVRFLSFSPIGGGHSTPNECTTISIDKFATPETNADGDTKQVFKP